MGAFYFCVIQMTGNYEGKIDLVDFSFYHKNKIKILRAQGEWSFCQEKSSKP